MPPPPFALPVVLSALFLSGTASIVNQVVWQRGVKILLGGSESISAMIVVLVFMLGLGIGAAFMGARTRRLANPLRAFGWIELLLCLVNAGVALLFSLDVSDSIFAVQRLAVSFGIPLRVVYALGAMVVLLPPTVLMGATLPAASEACQKQLGATQAGLITVLFFLNTLGAVLGAFGSSLVLLPFYGQRTALLCAAALNLSAAALVFALGRSRGIPSAVARGPATLGAPRGWRPSVEELLGFGLGWVSLGYEMLLFRLIALAHEPLPFTFATTLCFFLLFWSVGVFVSSRFAGRLTGVFVATIVALAAVPWLYEFDRYQAKFSMFVGGLVYFIPCIGFGILYGLLVSRSAREWGLDVGRYYAFNTLGSCLGIASLTLVGYELPLGHGTAAIVLGLGILLATWRAREAAARHDAPARWPFGRLALSAALIAVVAHGWTTPFSVSATDGTRTYWGRDGVVEVHSDGQVYIDGLWHTHLSPKGEHIGGSYAWMMAVAALLSHDGPVEEVLVIGNGVGLTSSTFAGLPDVQIDSYEINRTLRPVLRDYRAATLGVSNNPQVRIRWMDARSGMALDTKQYDIIVSAPLHLRQAGSSSLLSLEYFELLESRLKPGGVVAVYSYEGSPSQAMLVRRTVGRVFAHQQTFDDEIILIASNDPIDVTRDSLRALRKQRGHLARQIATFERRARRAGRAQLLDRVDRPSADVTEGIYVITDDHPIVEYRYATDRLARVRAAD